MANAMTLNAYALPLGQPGLFARIRDALVNRREFLRTFEELNRLSDRELADLGLSRLNLRDVAHEAVYGR